MVFPLFRDNSLVILLRILKVLPIPFTDQYSLRPSLNVNGPIIVIGQFGDKGCETRNCMMEVVEMT